MCTIRGRPSTLYHVPNNVNPQRKPLHTFADVSGLLVNLSKSQALNVSLQPSVVAQLKHSFRFEWSDSFIRSLRINLSPRLNAYTRPTTCPCTANWSHTSGPGCSTSYPWWLELTQSRWLCSPDSYTFFDLSKFRSEEIISNCFRGK